MYIIINFPANYCLQHHSLATPTLESVSNFTHIPKDTNLHQQRSTNLHYHSPTLYCIDSIRLQLQLHSFSRKQIFPSVYQFC